MFNGVFGHKPTQDIINMEGWFPVLKDDNFNQYHTFGQLTRYAEDLPMILKAMCGSEAKKLHLDEPVDVKKLKIYYFKGLGYRFGFQWTTAQIKNGIYEAVNHFDSIGCQTEEIDLHEFSDMYEICCVKYLRMNWIRALYETAGLKEMTCLRIFAEVFKKMVFASKLTYAEIISILMIYLRGLVPESKVQYYNDKCDEFGKKMLSLLDSHSVLLLPTFQTTAFMHFMVPRHASSVTYCAVWNLFGVPATQIPISLSSGGLPYGLQVIAGPYNDRYCIAIAKELEKKFGGWKPPGLCTVKKNDIENV